MSCTNKNTMNGISVVRFLTAAWLALAASVALAVDSGDIVVVSQKGEVHITVNGVAQSVRAGGVLEPPATLRTGRDGGVELKQGATTVSVGPDTLLEFPALEKRGAPIDRIVQPRGNAFYNIGKREGRKLRVETPYLVGVIKGTQFNVAAQDEATTISLFEGALEVHATDESAVVDLKAGEIASRKRGDKSISVIKMESGKAPANAPRAPSGSSSNGAPGPTAPRAAPSGDGGGSVLVDRVVGVAPLVPSVVDTVNGTGAAVGGNGADVGVTAATNLGNVADATANAAVNVGAAGVDVAAGTRVDAGPVSVDAAAAVNVGGGSVDVAASTSVDAGPVSVDTAAAVNVGGGSVDVTTSTSVDAGPVAVDTATALNVSGAAADLTTGTSVDAGPVAVGVGASTQVDVAQGTLDAVTTTSVDAGPLTTDVGTATAADLGAGTVSTNVDVVAATPLTAAPVEVGVSTAVDAAAGTVDLGLGVAGVDLGLSVDLGLDGSKDAGPATDTADTTNTGTVVDVGGLLDGLLRRPGRK